MPSVTFISTFVERTTGLNMDMEEIGQGTGSGIVWDDKVLAQTLHPTLCTLHPTPFPLPRTSPGMTRCPPNPNPSSPNTEKTVT